MEIKENTALKHLLMLALPTMVITLSRTLMGFVDFAFVAQLSQEALAAITPAGITMWVIIGFGMGTVSLVSTFASQSEGKGDMKTAISYAWQGIYLGLIFGGIILPFVPVIGSVMEVFGHEPKVLELEKRYASIILYSLAPSMMAYGLQCFFIGIQKAKIAMVASLIANAFNALANYLLIFGKFGFPEWGIAGAAVGTVLSTILQTLILLAALVYFERSRLGVFFAAARFSRDKLSQLCRFGIPSGVHWVVDILAWAIFTNVLIGKFGTSHLTASNIALQIMHLSFMPAIGLGQALSAAVGTAIGAKNYALAKQQTILSMYLSLIWMGGLGVVYWFAGGTLIGWMHSSTEVTEIGADIMKLAAIFQLFDAIAICTMSTLKGAGDTKWTANVSMISSWVIFIAGGTLMVWFYPSLGARGPWIAASVSIIFVGVAFWWRYRSGAWMKIDIFGKKPRRKLWRPFRVFKVWRRRTLLQR